MEVSAFDLDRTLIRGNSSSAFCRYLYKRGVLPKSVLIQSYLYYIRHHLFGMTLRQLHHSVFDRVLRGRPVEELEMHVEPFVQEYLKKALYMPAFGLLKRAQHLGHYTMILSNAPSFLVKGFAKFLEVNEFWATEYALDKEKRLSKIKKILDGRDKARVLKEKLKKLGIMPESATVCSDSWFDIEFLQVAGKPIAVNPDKRLKAFSLQEQWQII